MSYNVVYDDLYNCIEKVIQSDKITLRNDFRYSRFIYNKGNRFYEFHNDNDNELFIKNFGNENFKMLGELIILFTKFDHINKMYIIPDVISTLNGLYSENSINYTELFMLIDSLNDEKIYFLMYLLYGKEYTKRFIEKVIKNKDVQKYYVDEKQPYKITLKEPVNYIITDEYYNYFNQILIKLIDVIFYYKHISLDIYNRNIPLNDFKKIFECILLFFSTKEKEEKTLYLNELEHIITCYNNDFV